MRKRIAIFGGSLFQDIKLEKNTYRTTAKQAVVRLAKCYDIDNYSMEDMSIRRAFRLIQSLPVQGLYNDCILALGEADLGNVEEFRNLLPQIISYLLNRDIRPLLVSLPKDLLNQEEARNIQSIIDDCAVAYNIDYIYEGNTSKTVSYVVLDDHEMGQAIVALCN